MSKAAKIAVGVACAAALASLIAMAVPAVPAIGDAVFGIGNFARTLESPAEYDL